MDYQATAHMARWAIADTIYQLDFIPEDKLAWKPAEGVKSVGEMVGEIVMVFRMVQPLFAGEDMPSLPPEVPATIAEAKAALQQAGEAYTAALEKAGPELNRTINSPMGQLAADTSVLYPCVELIHHHGQITFIQSLLGDHEQHADMQMMQEYWGPKAG